MENPSLSFWENKRVLVTGHSGFKGAWLAMWLKVLGAEVVGISLKPETEPNLFTLANVDHVCYKSYFADIRHLDEIQKIIDDTQPEVAFHLAAQALVREGYRHPHLTFSSNIMGTVNVLEALRECPTVQSIVAITTDKVYENKEWPWPYRENDVLGGKDPYSASKSACEMVIKSYRDSFFNEASIGLASARAGNVIGGGDWAHERLLPDAIRAWLNNETLFIRNPQAVRPWQHVLEPLCGYLILAERLYENADLAGAYNFGPSAQNNACVLDVLDIAQKFFPDALFAIDNPDPNMPEAKLLALDTYRANAALNVYSRWNLEESLRYTCQWYQKAHQNPKEALKLCLNDIATFTMKE